MKKIVTYVLDWTISIIGYALILIAISQIFKNTLKIDSNDYGLWALLISLVIFLFNKTIKPILVSLTLPITALTLGIFYPFINLFILKLVDILFQNHFIIHGFWMSLFISVLISLLNMLMEKIIVEPILKGD